MDKKITLEDVTRDIDNLVSLPSVFIRLNQLVESPRSSVNQIADVISTDPGLTARLLRMANSAMFGMRKEVDTISKAVNVVGLKRLRDLALATSTIKAFEKTTNPLLPQEDFWLHSIRCGLAAKFLAEQARLSNSDTLFIAGLLHDIGDLLMFKRIPEVSREAIQKSVEQTRSISLHQVEQEMLGFDHAMVGTKLAEHWNLPAIFVEAIRWHHEPEKATQFKKEVAIVHIANSLAVCAELNSTDIEATDAPPILPAAWTTTGLTPEIIPIIFKAVNEHTTSMRDLLLAA